MSKAIKNRAVRVPIEEPVFKRYSPHHEFPLSTITSIAVHGLIFGLLALVGYLAFKFGLGNEGRPVPADVVQIADLPGGGGGNPKGVGSGPADGATGDKDAVEAPPETPDPVVVAPKPEDLLAAREEALKLPDFQDDNSKRLVQEGGEQVDKILELTRDTNNKLLKGLAAGKGKGGRGSGGGEGAGQGKGKSDGVGDGDGGGSARLRRMMRWNMDFNTRDGNDYARQLDGLGAILAVPDPKTPGEFLVIRNLKARPVKPVSEDVATLHQIFWRDKDPRSIVSLATALGLKKLPAEIVAFFPEELEARLLDMELKYRNVPEDDIRETRFEVRRIGAKYVPVVISQK